MRASAIWRSLPRPTAKVDVILAASTEAARAAKFGVPRVPSIFVMSGDPVVEGFVKSVARPAMNATGVTTSGDDLSA